MRNASAISVFAMKHPCSRALICATAFSIVWYWTVHKSCGMLSLMLDPAGWERWCISRYEPWYVNLGLAFFLRGAARVLTMCQEHGKQENLEVGLTPAGFVLGHIAAERHVIISQSPLFSAIRRTTSMWCASAGASSGDLTVRTAVKWFQAKVQCGQGQGLPLGVLLSPSFVCCQLLAGVLFSFCCWWCPGVWAQELMEFNELVCPDFSFTLIGMCATMGVEALTKNDCVST